MTNKLLYIPILPFFFEILDLTDNIKAKMGEVELIEEYGSEIKFSLPGLSKNIDNYSQLFIYLSNNKETFGIQSFGLSDTSLEEVLQYILLKKLLITV